MEKQIVYVGHCRNCCPKNAGPAVFLCVVGGLFASFVLCVLYEKYLSKK